MSRCCTPKGYRRIFGDRTARRDARRYRRRGLDGPARRVVDFLRRRGIENASVLEIGGGVGAVQLELLAGGAARALNLELSPAYEKVAAELAREGGLEGRLERRLGDVVEQPDLAGPADAVVMNKVVCCYPDHDALVGAAAERARRWLVLTFPRDRRVVRLGFGFLNVVALLMRWEFRSWIHPPAEILAAAERRGLRLVSEESGFVWRTAGLERVP